MRSFAVGHVAERGEAGRRAFPFDLHNTYFDGADALPGLVVHLDLGARIGIEREIHFVAQGGLRRDAENFFGGRVEESGEPCGIDDDNAVGVAIDDSSHPGLAGGELAPAPLQLPRDAPALDCIRDRAAKDARLQGTLRKVVLRAVLHGFAGKRFVVEPG